MFNSLFLNAQQTISKKKEIDKMWHIGAGDLNASQKMTALFKIIFVSNFLKSLYEKNGYMRKKQNGKGS